MDTKQEIQNLKNKIQQLEFLINRKLGAGSADVRANIVHPSSVPAGAIGADSITQAMIAAAAVGISEYKYETATLTFASGDTSKTATITSGSIVVGVYSSTVTSTPAYGELQLSISGTTLTGTRSASPGGAAAITYTVILLKI